VPHKGGAGPPGHTGGVGGAGIGRKNAPVCLQAHSMLIWLGRWGLNRWLHHGRGQAPTFCICSLHCITCKHPSQPATSCACSKSNPQPEALCTLDHQSPFCLPPSLSHAAHGHQRAHGAGLRRRPRAGQADVWQGVEGWENHGNNCGVLCMCNESGRPSRRLARCGGWNRAIVVADRPVLTCAAFGRCIIASQTFLSTGGDGGHPALWRRRPVQRQPHTFY